MFLHNRIATPGLGLVTVLAWCALATAQSSNLFTTLSLNTVGTQPLAVAGDDFNGDGFPERAAVKSGSNSVSILLGSRNDNFEPSVITRWEHFPTATVAGDFNRNGHLDLAVANYAAVAGSGSVSILLGNGDGTFAAGATYSMLGLEALDFTGDGKPDLAIFSGRNGISLIGTLVNDRSRGASRGEVGAPRGREGGYRSRLAILITMGNSMWP
jgi:hypothetical protein